MNVNKGTYVDVICLSETNMSRGSEVNLKINNFVLAASYSRKNCNRGGVAIIVRNDTEYKEIKEIEQISETYIFECCGVNLIKYGLVVICIYTNKAPSSSKARFFHKLNQLLETACLHKRKKYILCGDFNIDTLKKSGISEKLLSDLEIYNLRTVITKPTRITDTTSTCIDHIISDIQNGMAAIHDLGLSDHTAQTFQIPTKRQPPPIKWWYEYKRDYSQENVQKFQEYISSLSFQEVLSEKDANDAFNLFYELYVLFYNLCFPVVKVKVTSKKNTSNWLCKSIRSCCAQKRQLYLKSRYDKNYKSKYITYSKNLKKLIISRQKTENTKYIYNAKSKCKGTWDVIKKHTTIECNKRAINKISTNNTEITDPQIISNSFNNHFIDSVRLNCNSNAEETHDINIDSVEQTMFLTPVDSMELIRVVTRLNNSKSVGFDDIRTDIIKNTTDNIILPLLHAINLSLEQGTFPDVLKQSIVKPLYKKDDKCNLDNYRPITLIPIFSKIYEKVMYNRLYNFLEKNKIITDTQHGFRKHRSTSMATFKLISRIMSCVDLKIPISVIFMDMSKAFDFVSHKRLISKLYRYGVRGPAAKWISSYLSNRTQCVDISRYCPITKSVIKYKSASLHNRYGVPQGGILAPLLFLTYINDMPNHLSHECILFADDTTLIVEGKDITKYNDDLNTVLNEAVAWLSANNLQVNIKKTKLMQFCNSKGKKETLNIVSNDNKLEEIDEMKFLGITIDSHCNWKAHINNVYTKINKFIYAIRKVSQQISRQAAKMAYSGYIDSALRYGIIIWGNSCDISRLFLLQKRCVRAIFGLRQRISCRPYFKEHNILPLPCLYILETCIFVYNNKNLFQSRQDVTSRTVRSQYKDKLNRPHRNLALTSNNCYMMSIDIYNNLPDTYKRQPLNIFKSLTTRYLIDNCFYSVKEYLDSKP